MRKVLGICNLHDSPKLGLLTEKRPLAAVSFLGRYGLIDFTLSNFTNSGIDYLISPVLNAKGDFYDSRLAGNDMPKDADANGAYNIARKGLMMIDRLKETGDDLKADLLIRNKEWLKYAQGIK